MRVAAGEVSGGVTVGWRSVLIFRKTVAGGIPVHNGVTVAATVACRERAAILQNRPMKATLSTRLSAPAEREVREQIDRIVASATFRPADRLKHFIAFVAGQVLQGKGDSLKEYAVGVQVFGRDAGFDPRTDPVVRVQARRLRARLERYYTRRRTSRRRPGGSAQGRVRTGFQTSRRAPMARPASTASPQRNTVAVLPIVDLTPDRRLEPFCSGLSRELIRRLLHHKPLKIASAFSSQAAPGMALEGAIHEAADGLRLSINLVNATTRLV